MRRILLASAWLFGLVLSACQAKPTLPLAPLRTEAVVENTEWIVDLDFAPDGRLFYTTQAGQIYVLNPADSTPPALILTLDVARATSAESGLLGLALSPTFAADHHLFVYATAPNAQNAPLASRLTRYTLQNGQATEKTVLLDLPARPDQLYHFGGALTFGPDGKLYLIFGDTNLPDQARNPQSPHGAILRLNPNGTRPEDNPFPGSFVYAYGIRNGFGLAWHPENGTLYETENGASCDDELNRIVRGQDYGWGLHPYDACPYPDDATPPLYEWTPVAAPTNLLFYQGTQIPEWQGKLLICGFNRRELYLAQLSLDGRRVETMTVASLPGVELPCRVALAEGPDGWVYVAIETGIYRIGR